MPSSRHAIAQRPGLLSSALASRLPRRLFVGALFVGLGCQATAPAVVHGQAAPAAEARKADDIQKDISETQTALGEAMPGMDALMDPAKRAELKPKVVPLMRKMSNLFGELATASPEAKRQLAGAQMELRALMALLGDQQADDEIAKLTVSADAKESTDAKSWSLLVRWVKARADAAAQEKLAGEFTGLARSQPDNGMIAQAASLMVESAATPALGEQVEKVVADELKSPQARQLAEANASKRKMKGIEGKPLVIEGVALDGSKFSTAGWKGKVVLIDFWATWCPPCMAEVPSVKKAYAEFHDKGLEIVGVSCDRKAEDLKAFLAKNKEAAWPQLFDPAKPGWHPLAEQFGVDGIPTMFLIDRKGIVRSISARESYQEMIPKLLAEKE